MRMIVILDEQEAEGLAHLAREGLRDLPKQLRYILRVELARRSLWRPDSALSPKSEKEATDD